MMLSTGVHYPMLCHSRTIRVSNLYPAGCCSVMLSTSGLQAANGLEAAVLLAAQ